MLRIGEPRPSGQDANSNNCCKICPRRRYHLTGGRTGGGDPAGRLGMYFSPVAEFARIQGVVFVCRNSREFRYGRVGCTLSGWFEMRVNFAQAALCHSAYGWILHSAIGPAGLLHLRQLSLNGVAAHALRRINGNMTVDNSAAIEAAQTWAPLGCGTDARSVLRKSYEL
jgi:hypothetical protein